MKRSTQKPSASVASMLTHEFSRPGSLYRGKPFWAWNGDLEPEELRRQVRIMHRMGLGGFFMHSRVGLVTPYLSKKWFECVDACVDEAAKLDMEAWLYDEDRWPSGPAGGLVTTRKTHRMRYLGMTVLGSARGFKWRRNILAVFTARIEDACAYNVQRVAKNGKPIRLMPGHSLLVFTVEVMASRDWYNGGAYLDTMSHAAVKEFIRVTHEAYRKRVGKHFGKTIPGIFTDEPTHGDVVARKDRVFQYGKIVTDYATAWTAKLPQVFKQRYGYDLIAKLPALFFDVDGVAVTPARHDYHDCCTFLFVDAFARQIGEWCERNKMAHTGHVLLEDSLFDQTNMIGSCMRFYEHMQAPGMDLLSEHWRAYDTAKQVSSAARQFGRMWRLTETYGCTGWDFPLAGHKALGDWQTALGINLRCQHLSWYTMEGEAKRDCPASILHQSPWWEAYPRVEDYFARIYAVMTRGEEVRDLLVIHPVESSWCHFRVNVRGHKDTCEADRNFFDMRDELLFAHLDFDYGDEDIMARHGRVKKTREGVRLVVGKATYKAVAVPGLRTMRASTLKLLSAFKAAGGTVVFTGDAPSYVDALPSSAARDLAATCPRVEYRDGSLARELAPACRRISMVGPDGAEIKPTLYLLREDKEAFYLFICNTGQSDEQLIGVFFGEASVVDRRMEFPTVTVRFLGHTEGAPLELDPNTGASFAADATRMSDGWTVRTSLPRLGSRLFVFPRKVQSFLPPARHTGRDVRQLKVNQGPWPVSLSEGNNLVLDFARYQVGDTWYDGEEILKVDRAIRRKLGLPPRGGDMVQPWAREKGVGVTAPVALAYEFDIRTLPSSEVFLALERPRGFEITLNGETVSPDSECGWWVDPSMRTVRLDAGTLKQGRNELVLRWQFSEEHPGLEMIYLLGAFGVELCDGRPAIAAMPTTLQAGDWTTQGLAFYSGCVTYRMRVPASLAPGERLIVRVPDYQGVGVAVRVNGRMAGVIAWEPNEVDITDFVAGDDVEVGIEILGHRRNSHGPLHHRDVKPESVGSGTYMTEGEHWRDEYNLVPCGLMQAPEFVVRA